MDVSIPKGTRDFTPEQVNKRNYIVGIIKKAFVKFGYQPIETPSLELLSTLTGKYGEEGDRLLFKVLNNGDFLTKAKSFDNYKKLTTEIADRGLRYDLTVPFARFVVMHQNDLAFPFKRYQIQPVWRGDRPQRGRYQEFWQCDADVVGSNSLLNEVELVQMIDEVFTELGFEVAIKLNNRKVLAGMAEVAGVNDKLVAMTVAIDKLDKIGIEGVRKEMTASGISEESITAIEKVLACTGLDELAVAMGESEMGQKGVAELREVFRFLSKININNALELDFTLARGLSYYTGAIFEVKAKGVNMGSILGGGRYDDLTAIFGLPNMSGVGISFGLDRIYDVMNELNLYPDDVAQTTQLLLVTFDEASFDYGFGVLQELRAAGIRVELYPEPTKIKKQMTYANKLNVPYVAVIGDNEMASGELGLKDMVRGVQESLTVAQIVEKLGN